MNYMECTVNIKQKNLECVKTCYKATALTVLLTKRAYFVVFGFSLSAAASFAKRRLSPTPVPMDA